MEVRTLKELVEKYGLPLSVKRQSWFGDYYFCAEGVDHSGFVSGKIYNNGMPHKMQIFADTEIMELYKTDVGEIVERNNDESGINPNGLDTNKSNYKKGETKLFVTKNGNVVSAYFDRFEFKNGKTLIYVTCEGEQNSGFYPFPETTYVFSNKDDANHVIDKENRSIIDATSANATVLAFQSMPLAKEVSDSVSIEMEREKAYHKEVDDDLRNTLRNHQANLDEENQRLYTVNYAFREECAAAREEGYALDLQAQISHQIKADNAKRKINRFEKDISRVKNIRKKPYVGRVDCGKNANDLHTAYIGDCDIPGYVVDWRNSNIGNAYYHYETLMNSKDVFLALRRTFTIDNGVFERYEDGINLYNGEGYKKCESDYVVSADDFLTKLLMESRLDKTTHDIIKTIQGEQYDIITSDFSRNAVVNGCAGSGKTMIMYHRLSYMAYNYKNVLQREFDPNNVYIVSPSSFFDISNNELLKKLSIDKIYQAPFFDQVENLICKYCSNKNIFAFQGIMSLKKDTVTDISKTMVLNKARFNSFLSELEKLDNNLELKKEYNKWIVETANYILSSQGFKTLPKSFMPSTQTEIEYLFKSHDYYLNKCFIRKSDEDETTYFYPSAITSISYKDIVDEFYSDITNSKGDIQRNKRIQKHIGLLKASLSTNTETRLGAIENKISEFATILNNATVFQRMIALITAQRLLECLLESKSSNRDYILKCVFIYKKYFSNATASEYSVFILRALSEKFGEAIKEESLIFVDEFQNYSPFELDCLKGVFAAPIFNLFGDYDQRIEDKGTNLKLNIANLLDPNSYNLDVNYRNARQITEYINRAVQKNMKPIGIDGMVEECSLSDCTFEIKDRTAIICKNDKLALTFLKRHMDTKLLNNASASGRVMDDRISFMTVSDCKGLEFDKVYVLDYDMSDNERYVAYTRALDHLIVITDNLEQIKQSKEEDKRRKAEYKKEQAKLQRIAKKRNAEILRLKDVFSELLSIRKAEECAMQLEEHEKMYQEEYISQETNENIQVVEKASEVIVEAVNIEETTPQIVLNNEKTLADKEKILAEEIKRIEEYWADLERREVQADQRQKAQQEKSISLQQRRQSQRIFSN